MFNLSVSIKTINLIIRTKITSIPCKKTLSHPFPWTPVTLEKISREKTKEGRRMSEDRGAIIRKG